MEAAAAPMEAAAEAVGAAGGGRVAVLPLGGMPSREGPGPLLAAGAPAADGAAVDAEGRCREPGSVR